MTTRKPKITPAAAEQLLRAMTAASMAAVDSRPAGNALDATDQYQPFREQLYARIGQLIDEFMEVTEAIPKRNSPDAAQRLMEATESDEDDPDELLGATDCPHACHVEPDGTCPHGYRSAALSAGVI
jgi:hypothetical protein